MDNNNKKPQQTFSRNSKACQSAESIRKSNDLQSSKPWPRDSRRREQSLIAKSEPQRNKQQYPPAKGRPNVDKRPRPRGGNGAYNKDSASATDNFVAAGTGLATQECAGFAKHDLEFELNSVYSPGSKKQNLNHLLNFHYAPREADHSVFGRGGYSARNGSSAVETHSRHSYGPNTGAVKKHKYNKEQFLQANFQFVIKSCAKPKLTASPDVLIDWNVIEQINIQTTEEPQCPICLYPPIAAKLTRCGHAFCWPCLLHYLALSDKKWRKCPICYEAIHTTDLKSTAIVQQHQNKIGEQISFQLMRRKKGSMFIEKFTTNAPTTERYPLMSCTDETRLFSKFLIAKRCDILAIIEREQRELAADEDVTCPEFVFVQQALDLLKERREKIGNIEAKDDEDEEQEQVVTAEMGAIAELLANKHELKMDNELKQQFEVEENNELEAVTIADISNGVLPVEITVTPPNTNDSNTIMQPIQTKYYYFYQSADGQNVYLHPLNVKMLQACFGSLDRAPLVINARILQKEQHSMNEEQRRKFTCLGHLPLTCQFSVVEVDLQPPIVTRDILHLFKDDIILRSKERQRRERDERKREKHINEINDRQMGKLIASTINLNLGSADEFPTCGFEESLFSSTVSAVDTIATPTSNRQVSYSSVAVGVGSPKADYWHPLGSPIASNSNRYQKLSPWGVKTPENIGVAYGESVSNYDADSAAKTAPLCTKLSDVLAEAISQKQLNAATQAGSNGVSASGANKKSKKAKKMLPLFSTGINYKGN